MPMDSIWMCSNNLYTSNVDTGRSLSWLSASTMTLWHQFDSTSDPEPQNMSQVVWINVWGYCCMPMDSIWMSSSTLYFEVAVNHNHDVMTSVWHHKWPWTPKYEPSSVGITVWGYCHMPMDSIWMFSNTFYMSNVYAGRSLSVLSAWTMT
jgi:hypothetical protein